MIDEMDLLHMDERQRAAWLSANRATVMLVGLTWLGMIVWELAHSRSPTFLIVMVPVFALFRLAAYFAYVRADPRGTPGRTLVRGVRIGAAVVLAASAVLPLYALGDRRVAGWQVAIEDVPSFVVLAFAFLWPGIPWVAERFASARRVALVVRLAAPLFAAASSLVVLWVPQIVRAHEATFAPWVLIPVGAEPRSGVLVAVAANGAYVLAWFGDLFRPRPAGDG